MKSGRFVGYKTIGSELVDTNAHQVDNKPDEIEADASKQDDVIEGNSCVDCRGSGALGRTVTPSFARAGPRHHHRPRSAAGRIAAGNCNEGDVTDEAAVRRPCG